MSNRPAHTDVEALLALCADAGETDEAYLRFHGRRFVVTHDLVAETLAARELARARVLDVGAHWLHQALLYRARGHDVTATDLSLTLARPGVRELAARQGIRLLPNDDLERPEAAWQALPDDSFDVVLFTEIIEHLTFNPIRLWREIHRVTAPGGVIVVSTPNYYALRGLVPRVLRFFRGRGGGIPCQSILAQPTYAHHWKEFSASELRRFFGLLSPDFRVHRVRHVRDYYPTVSRLAPPARMIEAAVPILRPNLHLEIMLPTKSAGIVAEAAWAA